MELWELTARESIRDLVARYNANGDTGRFAQVMELFTDDGAMEIVTADGDVRRYEGHDAMATIFTGTQARWETEAAGARRADGAGVARGASPGARGRPRHVRHFTATHQIDLGDRTHATGRSYFAVLMAHGLDHWGRYVDTYEERDGRWLFTLRRALTDGHREGIGG